MKANKQQDAELLCAIQVGDSIAYETLLVRYRPLVMSLASSFSESTAHDPLEIRVEAEYALYRAALSFDTTQDVTTFGLYAKVCIRNRLISHFSRKKHSLVVLSLDNLMNDDGSVVGLGVGEAPEAAFADREAAHHLEARIRSILSEYEQEVFFLWLDAYTTREIASRLDRDEKSISNAISRSLSKLRQAL